MHRSEHIPKLVKLAYDDFVERHPSIPAHAIPKPKYSDTTANGLTAAVIDFIKYNGGQAERISNTGRYLVAERKWIPGSGTNGTADISSTVPVLINGLKAGLSVKWEVKIGRDTQSEDQKRYQQSVEESGGTYYIVRSFDDFYEKYLQLIQRFL